MYLVSMSFGLYVCRYWMDALLGDFIPFFVVSLGNVAIVTRIIRAQRKRADEMRVVAKDDGKVRDSK